MEIVAPLETQRAMYRRLALAGLAAAAVGGAVFVVLLARRRKPSRSGRTGFAVALAAALALQLVLPSDIIDRVVPAAPALIALAFMAFVTVQRRVLFPGLDRSVLEASVPESGGGIVVFSAEGLLIDSGSNGLTKGLALDRRETIEGFLTRVRSRLEGGRFFTAEEIERLGADEPGREVALRGPDATTHYLVFANPVREGQGPRLGVVFGFYDISRQKRIEAELDAKNAELDAKNVQLEGYLVVAGRLEEERERRAVAEEVHRTLGSRIGELLEAARGQGGREAPAGLDTLLAGCREVIGEIRATVRRLDPDRGPKGGPA